MEALNDDRLKDAISFFKGLSSTLGVAGAFVSFFLSFFGGSGPDPAIMAELKKLQDMVKEAQIQIAVGIQEVLSAISQLNFDEALRHAQDDITKLDTLVRRHVIENVTYSYNDYSGSPCGYHFSDCNNAFTQLADKFDGIL
jgi:hypothetical protein